MPMKTSDIVQSLQVMVDGQDFGRVSDDEIRSLFTVLVRLYAQKVEATGERPDIVDGRIVTPTEAVVVVTELLHALDINLFDLAMWYRRPEPGNAGGGI